MARRRKKGKEILELLSRFPLTTADLILVFSLPPKHIKYKGVTPLFGYSSGDLEKVLARARQKAKEESRDRHAEARLRNVLSYLRKEGLVAKEEGSSDGRWRVTSQGASLLSIAELPDVRLLSKVPSRKLSIVSYDIPEKARNFRNWLRGALQFLDFKQVHQSVWVGKTEIPVPMSREWQKHNMKKYIHIFTLDQQGTMREL